MCNYYNKMKQTIQLTFNYGKTNKIDLKQSQNKKHIFETELHQNL